MDRAIRRFHRRGAAGKLCGIVLLPPFFNFGTDCRPVWVGLTSLLLNDKSEAKSVSGISSPIPSYTGYTSEFD
ncbi:MAG: hypothetical protein IKM31_10630, partial [Oscillospiraceae bacterium]|nr:hypothetical protein [Oscillospiraceae bacterium]